MIMKHVKHDLLLDDSDPYSREGSDQLSFENVYRRKDPDQRPLGSLYEKKSDYILPLDPAINFPSSPDTPPRHQPLGVPKKSGYDLSTDYYDKYEPREGELAFEGTDSVACLLREVAHGIDSATPVTCKNSGCKAFRQGPKDEVVIMASACLTDARP